MRAIKQPSAESRRKAEKKQSCRLQQRLSRLTPRRARVLIASGLLNKRTRPSGASARHAAIPAQLMRDEANRLRS